MTVLRPQYADPVSDLLDVHRVCHQRLFREHCVLHRGNFVKDLSRLGRDISQVIIVDNSPYSYLFHPRNAVPITVRARASGWRVCCQPHSALTHCHRRAQGWFFDPTDTELRELIPFLEDVSKIKDVRKVGARAAACFVVTPPATLTRRCGCRS